jgi:hypothetical protein
MWLGDTCSDRHVRQTHLYPGDLEQVNKSLIAGNSVIDYQLENKAGNRKHLLLKGHNNQKLA